MRMKFNRNSIARHFPLVMGRQRMLSTSDTSAKPLLLSMPSVDSPEPHPRILYPKSIPSVNVKSVKDIQEAVEKHYSLQQNFVGAMGESDAGVWFVPSNGDPLHFLDDIRESIEQIKMSRHGVPFGVYTSGVVMLNDEEGLNCFHNIQVSLLAANPMDYLEASGTFREEQFGEVCNFLVEGEEKGLALEVGVLKKFASEGRELAMALGAQEVHVYDDDA